MKKSTVRTNPKLSIKRESIKQLTDAQLGNVAGGCNRCTGSPSGCGSQTNGVRE